MNKLIKLVIAILTILFLASPVLAVNWVIVKNNKNIKTYMDKDSVQIDSGIIFYWIKYKNFKMHIASNCSNNKYAIVETYKYSTNGKLISKSVKDSIEMKSVVPDSIGEGFHDAACQVYINNIAMWQELMESAETAYDQKDGSKTHELLKTAMNEGLNLINAGFSSKYFLFSANKDMILAENYKNQGNLNDSLSIYEYIYSIVKNQDDLRNLESKLYENIYEIKDKLDVIQRQNEEETQRAREKAEEAKFNSAPKTIFDILNDFLK